MNQRRWSFSSFDDYHCGHKFYLRRVARVPAAVYFNAVAGKAFHTWTERFDRGDHANWTVCLNEAIDDSVERDGVPLERMRISGRKTQATPDKESYEHWLRELGPELCDKYIAWVKNKVIATGLPPDAAGNTVGIEYDLEFMIGTTPVKGYIDRIFEYAADDYRYLICDLKAGARKQVTVQLPTYVLGARKNGIDVAHGCLYYARKGTHTDPQDYSRWDEHRLAYLYEQAAAMEAQGFYLPRPSEECGWCSVRDHCAFAL